MIYNLVEPWKTLDPWQIKYIGTEPDKDCFILASRQSGKTTAMSIKAVELCVKHLKEGENVLILSITEKQGYHMLAKALAYASVKYPNKLITKGKDKPTKHRMSFTTGVSIYCFAAGETGEGLRGYTIKKLMIDEGSRMGEEFFVAVTPMLSVIGGSMDIASTPCGKEGFFYNCSKDDHFTKFYVSGEDCPRHSKEFLQRERERMSNLRYGQEYLALFLDELRRVFSEALIKKTCVLKRRERILPGRTYFYGCDVARKGEEEFTHEIIDRTDRKRLVHVESIVTKNVPIPQSARTIIQLNSQYHFRREYIDSGGMGITVCDILREDSANKRKVVEINNASRRYIEDGEERKKGILKEDLYENLVNLMESNQIQLLDDEDLKASLRSVQFEILNGKARYFGNYSHIAEGLVRSAWCAKDKSLKVYCA